MAVEDARLTARRELEGIGLTMETASYLADDRPPGGWSSLVTSDQLSDQLLVTKAELRAELSEIRVEIANLGADLRQEMRDQSRWVAMAIIGAMTVSVGATAVIGAALRFA